MSSEESEESEFFGTYEGERNENGERHGHGKTEYSNHDKYEGMYANGKRNGSGTYIFVNGARYVGEYLDNLKHGEGTFYYPDGSQYQGQWLNNKRHGRGTYTYVNGDTYEGEWKDHVRDGMGTYTFKFNQKYTGLWRNGKMHGPGELFGPGYKYRGTWLDGTVVGPGKYIFKEKNCQQTGRYILIPGEGEESKSRSIWEPDEFTEIDEEEEAEDNLQQETEGLTAPENLVDEKLNPVLNDVTNNSSMAMNQQLDQTEILEEQENDNY